MELREVRRAERQRPVFALPVAVAPVHDARPPDAVLDAEDMPDFVAKHLNTSPEEILRRRGVVVAREAEDTRAAIGISLAEHEIPMLALTQRSNYLTF